MEREKQQEKQKTSLLDRFFALSKAAKRALLAAAGVVLLLVALTVVFSPKSETTALVKTSLREVLESSQLSTAEYTYNSIVKVPIDPEKPSEEGNVRYHVAYKGTVKTGFDFTEIHITEDEKGLLVVIPTIRIRSVLVGTDLEFIFTDGKYNTEKTYAEAYSACCSDLEKKAAENDSLINTAAQSAVETLTALTKPFENQLEEGKTLRVVYQAQTETEETK